MGWQIIVIIVLAVLFVVAAAAALVFRKKYIAEKRRSDESARFAEDVKVRGGVRYSGDDAVEREGAANITLKKGDILLPRGETRSAERGGEIMPGTYTVLATGDNVTQFKLRVGGLVRTYSHGDTLVLAEGEEICAVSCAVILR